MRTVIQRVNFAKLKINNKIHSEIEKGYFILLGIHKNDSESDIESLVRKVLKLGIFENKAKNGYFNDSIVDVKGEILIASQFTLYANTDKGIKPSFSDAMPPKEAKILYDKFIADIRKAYLPGKVKTGEFAAYMVIELENDGPATFILESK